MGFARTYLSWACGGVIALLIIPQADADVMTDGYARITSFSFTGLTGWNSESSAHAFDSFTGDAFDFDTDIDAPTTASAVTPHATAHGEADPTSFILEANGSTSLLNPLSGSADADSYGFLLNVFSLGGSGTTNVNFALDYEMHLFGTADEFGDFEQTAFVRLEITDVASGAEVYLNIDPQSISGTNTTLDISPAGSFAGSLTLDNAATYLISITADNEHFIRNVVPEPSTLALSGLGAVLMALRRRRYLLSRRT